MTAPPFVAIVPARLASTRFPRKVLAEIDGVPMVIHCARRALASGAHQVVVATDHEEVRAAAERAGVAVVMTGSHHETGTDRLAEAVSHLELTPETLVVNVQGDEPLIEPASIRAVVQRLHESPHCAMATACYPITSRAHLERRSAVKVVLDRRDEALYFSRAPIPWARDAWSGAEGGDACPAELPAWHHVGLYAYRAAFLGEFSQLSPAPLERFEALEQLRALWHGYRIAVVRLESAPALGVDTPEDLVQVQSLWKTSSFTPQ
ncbi:MAG: 3-deoxy-manno-octulosonate cytidylyltransferase [Ferrovum sp.]|nr:3-deoxy-manno-octulosonate cytidylyltransferase [Ferrovum sp.]NDU86819.1 3-deoxy-manno-octulosonate cytidylyltransferase [Ferrovum sp.]